MSSTLVLSPTSGLVISRGQLIYASSPTNQTAALSLPSINLLGDSGSQGTSQTNSGGSLIKLPDPSNFSFTMPVSIEPDDIKQDAAKFIAAVKSGQINEVEFFACGDARSFWEAKYKTISGKRGKLRIGDNSQMDEIRKLCLKLNESKHLGIEMRFRQTNEFWSRGIGKTFFDVLLWTGIPSLLTGVSIWLGSRWFTKKFIPQTFETARKSAENFIDGLKPRYETMKEEIEKTRDQLKNYNALDDLKSSSTWRSIEALFNQVMNIQMSDLQRTDLWRTLSELKEKIISFDLETEFEDSKLKKNYLSTKKELLELLKQLLELFKNFSQNKPPNGPIKSAEPSETNSDY
ncbi:MAG: hypothetical protein SFT81_01975 [Candidatus Caenarcaniphilales bacterium]|nr:hypothetical protein [Candidatus Caenarcaniphilales bacterium]